MSSSSVRPCEYLLVAIGSRSRGEEAVEAPPARVYLVVITVGVYRLGARGEHLHRHLVRQRTLRIARQIQGPVLDIHLSVVRPREKLRVAELQFELRRFERHVAGRKHRSYDPHVEVQTLGETRDAYICLGLRNLVVTPVEVEGTCGELRTHLVSVSDLHGRSPEGDQMVHEVSLLLAIVPGRPAALCVHAARPRPGRCG